MNGLGRRRLANRLFIVVLPAQWLGLAVGWQVVARTGLVPAHPWALSLIPVLSGLLAGLGCGVFVVPGHLHRWAVLAGTQVAAALCWLVLAGATALGSGADDRPASLGPSLLGAALMQVSCAAVTWTCWRVRTARATAADRTSAIRAYGGGSSAGA